MIYAYERKTIISSPLTQPEMVCPPSTTNVYKKKKLIRHGRLQADVKHRNLWLLKEFIIKENP